MWARSFLAHQLLSPAGPNWGAPGFLGVGFMGMSMLGAGPGPPIWTGEINLQSSKPLPDHGRRALYSQYIEGHAAIEPLETVLQYLTGLPDDPI